MKTQFSGWLDVNTKHPELLGDAILMRDDDGMGFALELNAFRGKLVKVTIEVHKDQPLQYWYTPSK